MEECNQCKINKEKILDIGICNECYWSNIRDEKYQIWCDQQDFEAGNRANKIGRY